MITIPSSNKKWVTSFKGEDLGQITNSFGIDLFSSPGRIKSGGKYYPNTIGTLSGSSLTPVYDFITASISNGVTRPTKTWAVAGDKLIIRTDGTSPFSKDTATGFTSTETTGTMSDLFRYADGTGKPLTVTEIVIANANGAFGITGDGNNTKWAQSFTQVQGPFKQFTFFARKVGSPTDNLIVEIQSDNAGVPSGTVLTSLTLSAAAFTSSFPTDTYSYENTLWTTPTLQFNLDSVYHIVFRRSGSSDTGNYVEIKASFSVNEETNPYKNGELQQYNGSSWSKTVTFTRTDTFTSDGTWTVPTGITSATVECWAAGGSGVTATGAGGGGGYSRSVINVTAGNKHGITVGQESLYRTDGLASAFNGIKVLAVGGGGAGGKNGSSNTRPGGGGGGGGFIEKTLGIGVGTYSITVGDGGASNGANGGDSKFGTIITAKGGGGGGSNSLDGSNGGSGGGSPQAVNNQGTGIPGQGYDGGDGYGTDKGGGGGGAAQTGTTATASVAGDGGNGRASSISGSLVYYSGGGGGGGSVAGTGGTGGGGAGATTGNGTAGTANTGGGGGGSANNGTTGAAGGKGIVIVRYRSEAYTATGGTITTDGDYKVHTFTSNGTFEITAVNYSRVLADGGLNGYNGGTGGLTANGIGDVKYAGGSGFISATNSGGGGGAGDSADGQSSGTEIGSFGGNQQGGYGGGQFNTATAYYGGIYGGGGGSTSGNGYSGARGEVRITYNVTQTANYPNVISRFFGTSIIGTSHFFYFPTDIMPGETLLLIVSARGTATISKSGWTVLGSKVSTGNSCTQTVLYKIATGDDDGIFTSSADTGLSYVGYRIKNAGTPSIAFDTSNTFNSPNLNTSISQKYLWISACTTLQSGGNPTAPPSNYSSMIIQPEKSDYPNDVPSGQFLRGARTAVAERQLEATSEDPGAFTGTVSGYGSFSTIAIPYKLEEYYFDAVMSLQVEFPTAEERLYVTTSKDVKFLNAENGIWQSLWMGVFQQDALDSNYPHPIAYTSAGGLVFVGDGNVVHSFFATGVTPSQSTKNKLVFDDSHFVAWMGVTKSAIFIGLNAKDGETIPGYVVYYEPTSETTRIFQINEGHTVGWIRDDNCFILDKSGQIRQYTGISFPVLDKFPPYYQQLKINKLPHRNGIIAKDNSVMFLWEGQYPWGAGVWAYEDGRLYHKHPLVFDPTTLNSFGSYDVPTGWGALYDISDYTYAGASLYGTDNTTETKGVFTNFKTTGVTVSDSSRAIAKSPRFSSSQRDNIWQRVFAKIDYRPAGLVEGSVVLKYRQEAPDIGEGIYASSFTGTWTSATTFTTTDSGFKTAVDAGYIQVGFEVIVRRGNGAGLRAKIVSITGTTTRTVTIAEGLTAVTSGTMNFSVENWRVIPNKDLVSKPSEWLQVQMEIRDKVELEELQVSFDTNETNIE